MIRIGTRYFFQNRNIAAKRDWRGYLGLSLGCFLLTLLLSMGWLQNEREALAKRLAPSVLRLHILADSDEKIDQEVKLEIRSLILDYLKEHLSGDTDKKGTAKCLREHRKDIESLADKHLKKRGMKYHASLQLTNDYFPTRVYDRYVFPCGHYDAARIVLGKGSGHNWWCVLYPQFCFTDSTCQPISEEQARPLSQELQQDDVLALKDHRPAIEIRFFLFPFLNPANPSPDGPHTPDMPEASSPKPSPAP